MEDFWKIPFPLPISKSEANTIAGILENYPSKD